MGGNWGCWGGWTHWNWMYLNDKFFSGETHKLMPETEYPYANMNDMRVHACNDGDHDTKGVVQLGDWDFKWFASIEDLKDKLQYGPVAVDVAASSWIWNYASGIYTHDNCWGHTNHAVVAVGWGHDDASDTDYWIIRNSWGSTWGEEGYMRLKIDDAPGDGSCNVREIIYWINDVELDADFQQEVKENV